MKVFIDQGIQHPLTKRMSPYWSKLGVQLSPVESADIHLAYVSFSKPSKLPKVLRLDGVYYDKNKPYMADNKPLKDSYKSADGIIFQSEYSESAARHMFGDTKARTTVIYNGADPSWNDPIEHEWWNIVVCSNWRKWKRLDQMIQLVGEMIPTYPTWRLYVVGGVQGGRIINENAPYVRWAGTIKHDKMREIYRKMDIAIHIAKRDWCPNVVLEFLAAGIPTVVSDKGGGSAEIMSRVNRELIALDDDDPYPLEPVEQYSDEWCKLSNDFKTNVQSKLQLVYKEWVPKRVTLPTEFTAEHAAEKYYEFMRSFI